MTVIDWRKQAITLIDRAGGMGRGVVGVMAILREVKGPANRYENDSGQRV